MANGVSPGVAHAVGLQPRHLGQVVLYSICLVICRIKISALQRCFVVLEVPTAQQHNMLLDMHLGLTKLFVPQLSLLPTLVLCTLHQAQHCLVNNPPTKTPSHHYAKLPLMETMCMHRQGLQAQL